MIEKGFHCFSKYHRIYTLIGTEEKSWEEIKRHLVKDIGVKESTARVQMLNITTHVCRHTYCSNMVKLGMKLMTIQYHKRHSDINVTMNVYTHISFDDVAEELKCKEEFRKVQTAIEKKNDAKKYRRKCLK